MSVSLYRKYRPQNFSSVTGQKAAIDVITNSIAKSHVGHAYLFSGSRGCGKTSVARIFAKALNCLNRENFEPCGTCKNCTAITAGESLDVIEIDGASNNGVDEVRELKANVALAPFSSKYKIYIIDEVHMLSTAAFNALLKTLEEPPEHVIFIMATTEPHKVPVTIRSRCQHIPFHSISTQDIFNRLKYVCENENVNAEDEALWEIARQADGALRDALSLLEQVIAAGAGGISLSDVEAVFGAGSRPAFERWIVKLRSDSEGAYLDLKKMFEAGASGIRIFEEMFSLVRNLWLVSKWRNIADNLGISEQEKNFLLNEAPNWKTEKLHYILNLIIRTLTQARTGVRNDILIGMFMIYIDGAPKTPAEPQKIFHEPKKIEENPKEIIFSEPPDMNLKESILNAAHEKNFMLYCGLFDAKPYEREGNLILATEHVYNYEVLRQDRNAAALSEIFDGYEKIILRYGQSESVCPKRAQKSQDIKTENKKISSDLNSDLNSNSEDSAELEPAFAAGNASAFDRIRQELSLLGARPELIFVKNLEENENENESENENDETSSSERENEE